MGSGLRGQWVRLLWNIMLERQEEMTRSRRGVESLFLRAKSLLERQFYGPISFALSVYLYLRYRSTLFRLIRNRRILIVGSGPSASELEDVPKDVLIFTCNRGLKLFLASAINRKVDLYLCQTGGMTDTYKDVETLLVKVKTSIFVINKPGFIRRKENLEGSYSKIVEDKVQYNYYLRRLIKPYTLRQIKGRYAAFTSSGMRLLQYALFYRAKEIYLIGVDIDQAGYFWKKKNLHWHMDIDREFIRIVSGKHNNIYSASKRSAITEYLKYRRLV